MGLFTRDIKTMNDLFVHQLQDIYYAEKQLVKALPKMADKATDKQLKQGFLTHLEETKAHVERLEQVFKMHGAEVKAVDCPAIDGIIEEADEVAGEVADKSVLDAALINAGAGCRALRDHALWQPDRVGKAARAKRLREHPAKDARRRTGNGQKADFAGREQGQHARRELIDRQKSAVETKRRAASSARRFALVVVSGVPARILRY